MSKIKIQGSSTGTGTLTIQAPTTSTDRTLNIPDSSGTLATTADVPSSITDNGDANAITIDSDEKVGINTASPNTPFHAYNNGTSWVARIQQANAAGQGFIVQCASTDNAKYGIGLYNGSTFPFYVKQDGYIFSNTTINATNMTQKGGVDIVAKGTNSNGSYTKWADGTMICEANKSTSQQNTGPSAGGYYHSNSGTWTYPVAFNATPRIVTNTRGGHWNAISSKTHNEGSTSCSFNTLSVNSTGNAQEVSLLAYGTWS